MITEGIATAAEYAAGLGLDAAKTWFKDKVDEKKLRAVLTTYIEGQRKYNEMCSLAEEIDFQGLVEYISGNLLDHAGTRFLDSNRRKREQARENIISAAVAYSKANTDGAKIRVSKCISICLDIIRNFYKSQFSPKDYLLAAEIVDAITEEVQASAQESINILSAIVNETKEDILAEITNNGALFSLDRAVALAEADNWSDIEGGFKKVLDHISLSHPLYPDFGYEYRGGMILSKPLTAEAKRLFPPKFILTGAVKFGDQYYNDPNGDPLDYAYRHQIPITMEVTKAIKLLGEKPDPRQGEVANIVGNTVVAMPPEFPPAFPCAIKVLDKTFFEYVLLRTQEIEDDGTYVIGNKEQGGSFYFEVRINPNSPSRPDFKVNMNHANNKELLNYVRFMNTLSKEKDLHIYVLSAGEDIIAGYINDMEYKTGFNSVDEEIDFLERVCAIEDYFGVTLDARGDISHSDYEVVIQVSDLIRNDEVTGTWSEATFKGVMSQNFRDKLLTMDKEQYMFSYVGISCIKLFGSEFELRFMRTFRSAWLADFEKVKRKAEVLDDGDEIKLTFRAGDDKVTIDSLKIPEKIESAS